MAVFWYKKDFKRFFNRDNHNYIVCSSPGYFLKVWNGSFRGGGIWRQIWWWQRIGCFIALARVLLTVFRTLRQQGCPRPWTTFVSSSSKSYILPSHSVNNCIISTYHREWYTSPRTSSFLLDPAYSILWRKNNIFCPLNVILSLVVLFSSTFII